MFRIIIFLLVGSLVGWFVGKLMKGSGFGWQGNLVVGIIGALIGGFVFSLLGIVFFGFFGLIINSFIGALIFVWLINWLKNK